MQKPPVAQGPQGELVEVSVTGGQELVVEAAVAELKRDSKSLIATSLHALSVGPGIAEASEKLSAGAVGEAVRPEPLPPVSCTFVKPSATRVKVNFGHTFSVESNVLEFIVIVPVEALKSDRLTRTFQASVAPLL